MRLDELLRRLALDDEHAVRAATGPEVMSGDGPVLEPKTRALVRLAALLAIGATTASCRGAAERARVAGASDEELVGVLMAVGPVVGAARVVEAAPRLALAIDYDVGQADAP